MKHNYSVQKMEHKTEATISGLRFQVSCWGLGCRAGFTVCCLGFGVQGLVFWAWCEDSRV